jgi:PRTRC genetic system protein B
MNDVVIECASDIELELESALLFYRSQAGSNIYATKHNARVIDGTPALMPGVPLTLDQLADIAEVAAKRTAFRGFVHERVVYLAPNQIAWWVPARTRRVWFATQDELGTRSGETAHPPLLFVVNKTRWFVFALRQNTRPDPSTKLYVAPYYNVWEGGEICTGNVETPDTINSDAIKVFEDAFFRSRFTHSNATRLIKRRGGAEQLWLDLLDGAAFPMNALVDSKTTLQQAINRIANERS